MGAVLTTESSIKCAAAPLPPGAPRTPTPTGHGGNVTITQVGTPKLKVNGQAVLLKSEIGPAVDSSSCQNPTSPGKQCDSATIIAGEAVKLKVGGSGVMLADSLVGTTNGIPPGVLSADAGQNKLTAV